MKTAQEILREQITRLNEEREKYPVAEFDPDVREEHILTLEAAIKKLDDMDTFLWIIRKYGG